MCIRSIVWQMGCAHTRNEVTQKCEEGQTADQHPTCVASPVEDAMVASLLAPQRMRTLLASARLWNGSWANVWRRRRQIPIS